MVEQNDSPSAIRIFVSYSHKDNDQKNGVIACLGATDKQRTRRRDHAYIQQAQIDTVIERGFRAKLKAAPTESLSHEY